jgi:hypothetical protein
MMNMWCQDASGLGFLSRVPSTFQKSGLPRRMVNSRLGIETSTKLRVRVDSLEVKIRPKSGWKLQCTDRFFDSATVLFHVLFRKAILVASVLSLVDSR